MKRGGAGGRGARRGLRVWGLLAAACAVWLAAGVSLQAAPFGELVVLQGRAVVTRGGKPFLVKERAPVEEGDRVDTLADSKAQLLIGTKESGAEAVLASRTSVVAGQLKPDPGLKSPLALNFGALRTRVRSWSGQPFIATRAAVIGIKGTDFVTWVRRPEAAEFAGVEGLIECVSQTNKAHVLRIGPRQWGEIVENVAPKPPVPVPDALWNTIQKDFAFPDK